MRCSVCGEPTTGGSVCQTLVYYGTFASGHDHDDNCRSRVYMCRNGHKTLVSRRNRCPAPGCDWVGKETCFCHPGTKVDEWPEANT